jgi:predicted MPP superfamily phosphohydrolase
MSKRDTRILPESAPTPPQLRQPADVTISRRWQLLVMLAGLWGWRQLQQHQWHRLTAALAATLGVVWYARYREPATPVLRRIEICDSRIPREFDGFTIGQISDIHLGQPHSHANLRWARDCMQTLRPDLIVFTGDLVNERPAIGRLAYELTQFQAPMGCFAIAGNHDYVEKIDDVIQACALAGIPLLRNTGVALRRAGATLWLAGVDDIWHGSMRIDHALRGADQLPIILLAHAPDIVLQASAYANIVLQLSGHVHGGHLHVPGLGPLARPRYGVHYTRGTHRVGNTWMHVSLGLSGRALRFGSPPEVGLITLRHHAPTTQGIPACNASTGVSGAST